MCFQLAYPGVHMRQKGLITDSQALIKAVALSNVERTLAFSRKMLAKNKGPCKCIILPWLPLDRQVYY